MTKKILASILILISVGIVFFTLGHFIEKRADAKYEEKVSENISDNSSVENDSDEHSKANSSVSESGENFNIKSGSFSNGSSQLPDFKNIDISVKAASVFIKHGDKFSISYELHRDEELVTSEVRDGTLYFTTRGEFTGEKLIHSSYHVTITVPKNSEFENVEIATNLGEIKADGLKYKDGSFESNLGNLELDDQISENIHCYVSAGNVVLTANSQNADVKSEAGNISIDGDFSNDVDIKTSMGNIEFSGNVKNLSKFKSSAGNITVDGDFSNDIEIKTSMGNIDFSGNVKKLGTFETSAGDITADIPDSSIEASCSMGTVMLNGNKMGRNLQKNSGGSLVKLKTNMGTIKINS